MCNETQESAISLTSHHPRGSEQEWAALGQTVVGKPVVVNPVLLHVILKGPFASDPRVLELCYSVSMRRGC